MKKIESGFNSSKKLDIVFIEQPSPYRSAWHLFQDYSQKLWQKAWQNIANWLIQPQELRVWQKRDRSGNTYWQAYNPKTGRTIASGSEAEIRMWIEQQLYQ